MLLNRLRPRAVGPIRGLNVLLVHYKGSRLLTSRADEEPSIEKSPEALEKPLERGLERSLKTSDKDELNQKEDPLQDTLLQESANVFRLWSDAVKDPKSLAAALDARFDIYDLSRKLGKIAQWDLDALSYLPNPLLADYYYAAETFAARGEWQLIEDLLVKLAPAQPTHVEVILHDLVEKASANGTQLPLLKIIVSVLLALDRPLADLQRHTDLPYLSMLKTLAGEQSAFNVALKEFFRTNPLVALSLASSLLDVTLKLPRAEGCDIAETIFDFKHRMRGATTNDLHRIMLRRLLLNNAEGALQVYRQNPNLKSPVLADALLLVGAQLQDWSLLQGTFKKLETSKDRAVLGAKHYAIVLQAVGRLGGPDLLDSLYKGFLERGLKPSRGVIHAIMASFCMIGDVKRARYYFDLLHKHDLQPVRSSFLILLGGYRDAKNLTAALDLVGQQLAEHQIPLSNRELTILLSLCAQRRDYESAERIFSWGAGLLGETLDKITYNAYLQCLVETNHGPQALQVYKNLPVEAGLDTLTTLLAGAARWANKTDFEFLVEERKRLGLHRDAKWYGAEMMYYGQSSNKEALLRTFADMKAAGLQPQGGHLGILLNFYARTRDLAAGQQAAQEFMQEKALPTFEFYKQWLRLLTMPGSTMSQRALANKTVSDMLGKGVFDISSNTIPRTSIGPDLLKRLVRRLIKSKDYTRAQKLLNSATTRQPDGVPEKWRFMGLYLELARARGFLHLLDTMWTKFVSELRQTFVPCTLSDGRVELRLPPRYRFDYDHVLEIRIDDLAEHSRLRELMEFPQTCEKLGLALSSRNLNQLVRALVAPSIATTRSQLLAFELADKRLARGYYLNAKSRSQKLHDEPVGTQPKHLTLAKSTIAALATSSTSLTLAVSEAREATVLEGEDALQQQFPTLMSIINSYLRRKADYAASPERQQLSKAKAEARAEAKAAARAKAKAEARAEAKAEAKAEAAAKRHGSETATKPLRGKDSKSRPKSKTPKAAGPSETPAETTEKEP